MDVFVMYLFTLFDLHFTLTLKNFASYFNVISILYNTFSSLKNNLLYFFSKEIFGLSF